MQNQNAKSRVKNLIGNNTTLCARYKGWRESSMGKAFALLA